MERSLSAKQYIMFRLNDYCLRSFIEQSTFLTERSAKILIALDFDLLPYEQIGDLVSGLSPERILQIAKKSRIRIAKELAKYRQAVEENESLYREIELLKYKLRKAEKVMLEHGKPPLTVTEIDAMTIEDMDLSVRLYNNLKCLRINRIGDIKEVGNEILNLRNFGKKSYIELYEKLDTLGVMWPISDKRLF